MGFLMEIAETSNGFRSQMDSQTSKMYVSSHVHACKLPALISLASNLSSLPPILDRTDLIFVIDDYVSDDAALDLQARLAART